MWTIKQIKQIGAFALLQYILSVVYLVMDAFMLSLLKNFYAKTYVHGFVNKVAGAFVWILYPLAITYFTRNSRTPLFDGALLGLTVYGVYHLTSAATFPNWHADVAIWDTFWGMVVSWFLAFL